MSKKSEPTPVMRQFLGAKAEYPDALLFFRMGDFYELFYEDAVVAARALDLTLTSRNKGAADEIPMAGVPHHAASQYVQRLLEQGFQVAICEQMADPSKVKGIVPREVVRVVSPGIAFDDAGLVARENHFLVVVCAAGEAHGLAALDLSTGELVVCEAQDRSAALAELVRIDPREVLAGPGSTSLLSELRATRPRVSVRVHEQPMSKAEAEAVMRPVLERAERVGAPLSELGLQAAARAVDVAQKSDPRAGVPVGRVVHHDLGDTLLLDEATQSHLELVRSADGGPRGSLLECIDKTRTPFGARLLRRRLLAPRTRIAEIRRRLDVVQLFVENPVLREQVGEALASIADLERLAVKIATARALPRDLALLRASLAELPKVRRAFEVAIPPGPLLPEIRAALGLRPDEPWIDPCDEMKGLLDRALAESPPIRVADGGVIRAGFDRELDQARDLLKGGQRHIVDLEGRLREEAQIPTLKLRYTRVFGWYMEVTRTHAAKAPSTWRRKQTIANGERFTCDVLDELADRLAHAEQLAEAREGELFAELVSELGRSMSRLRSVADRLAQLDVAVALAELAHQNDYVRPDVDESSVLAIEDGRHAVVEKLAAAGRFVANDVRLDADANEGDARLWLLTGPNMAGKSTLMRQTALIVILAQMGSFVPARRARVGVVDRVLTRVGASDNLSRGESTFMVEMKETANVLSRATKRSLVVLDEIGRGTSTYDGLAIAWAVAEYLHDVAGCRALFATHYHELTLLADTRAACQNWSVTAREHAGEIVFLHKLVRGTASRSYGVACARLAGIPEPVLARARVLLDALERGAELPSGGRASLRGRSKAGLPQLDLFHGGVATAAEREPFEHTVLQTLRAVDVDRLTPLEALQLVAELKKLST